MTDHSSDERRDRSTTRRRLLRGGAAAAGAALAPPLAGRASAQDEGADVTLSAALPADAPTYGNSDFVGLVVQVGNRTGDVDVSGIGTCPFVAQETAADQGTYTAFDEDKIWGYNAEIVQRDNVGGSGETTTLYSLAQNTRLGPEKRYIINGQQECGDYVQVQLELLSESGQGPEATATPAEGGGGTTTAATPGFGVLAALGGVGTAAAAALAARGGDADE